MKRAREKIDEKQRIFTFPAEIFDTQETIYMGGVRLSSDYSERLGGDESHERHQYQKEHSGENDGTPQYKGVISL
jgi:hypothetical protein